MMTVDNTPIGLCIYPLETDLIDYSRFERDEFGHITVIQRGYSDSLTFQVELLKDQEDAIKAYLSSLRSTSAEYKGHPNFSLSHITGYLRSLKISVNDWGHTVATIVVESDVVN